MSLSVDSETPSPAEEGVDIAWQANAAYDQYVVDRDQLQRWQRLHDSALIELTPLGRQRMTAEVETARAVFETLMERAGVLIGPGTPGGAVLESESRAQS